MLITAIVIVFIISAVFFYKYSSLTRDAQNTKLLTNQELLDEVITTNIALPLQLDNSTVFDSISINEGMLNYYYTLTELTKYEFIDKKLEDSLYTVAINRIPCTLWNPGFMEGIEVSFSYHSRDDALLLQFSKTKNPTISCH